jgi:hypothetical protein
MVHINMCPGVEIFDGSEGHGNTAYIQRVHDHPEGFVAQADKPDGAGIITIHRADCPDVSVPHEQDYTQGTTFMAFALSLPVLQECVMTWPGRVEYCRKCHPSQRQRAS